MVERYKLPLFVVRGKLMDLQDSTSSALTSYVAAHLALAYQPTRFYLTRATQEDVDQNVLPVMETIKDGKPVSMSTYSHGFQITAENLKDSHIADSVQLFSIATWLGRDSYRPRVTVRPGDLDSQLLDHVDYANSIGASERIEQLHLKRDVGLWGIIDEDYDPLIQSPIGFEAKEEGFSQNTPGLVVQLEPERAFKVAHYQQFFQLSEFHITDAGQTQTISGSVPYDARMPHAQLAYIASVLEKFHGYATPVKLEIEFKPLEPM